MSRPNSAFSAGPEWPSSDSSMVSRDQAHQMVARTQQRWSHTNDQLANAIRDRTISPLSVMGIRQKEHEIAQLQRDLAEIQAQMTQQQDQMRFQEATILQQQATIRNQSKAIENPRTTVAASLPPASQSNTYTTVPGQQPQHGQTQPLRSMYGPVPPTSSNPAFNTFGHGHTSSFGAGSTDSTPRSHHGWQAQRTNEYGSPAQRRHDYRNTPAMSYAFPNTNIYQQIRQNVMDTPLVPARNMVTDIQPFQSLQALASPASVSTNPFPETAIPSPSLLSTSPPVSGHGSKIMEMFRMVFDQAQQYAWTHANFPSVAGDASMPQEVKTRLLNAATQTTAFGLMSDPQTRHLLVAKVMIEWIIKHILKCTAFAGLDNNADTVIAGAKAMIYESTPDQVRYLMLNNISYELKKLAAMSNFADHVSNLSQRHAQQLFKIVRPMMHQQTSHQWEDMVTLFQDIYKLTELRYTTTDEFSLKFANHSQGFDIDTMINIDPVLGGYHAYDLKGMRATVRLGATPLIMVRRNSPNGVVATEVFIKGKVLLKR